MFIGQNHITSQLEFILMDTYREGSVNFLFRGPSGYGKTELAMRVANYYSGNNYAIKLGDSRGFDPNKRVHLIDEIHLCPQFELWYPIMDSNSHILIFTTNSDAVLPEAFIRRCYDFIFSDYSNAELKEIVRSKSNIILTDEQLDYVIEFCNRSPASILSIVKRLIIWQKYNLVLLINLSINEFRRVTEQLFGVVDGVDILCARYLDALRRFGGSSSLSNLKSALHIDEGTIKRDVEPALLYRGKIKITNKGRSLIT